MYKNLKTIAKLIIPRQLLEKNESFLRNLISKKYKGNNYQCNICEFKLNRFVNLKGDDLLCPNCGSRSRTRRLYKILNEGNPLKGNVLHFSAPKALSKKIKALDINYYSSDFENEFIADYHYDITSITKEDNFFDTIICYHVLEHIENDTKAMSELYRVLKPGGLCYIQTPYKDGDIFEDKNIIQPEEREKAFGQSDHVRIYSIKGLSDRLKKVGFNTDCIGFDKNSYFGFKDETVIIAKK